MANSADAKFGNIYKILKEHSFQLNVKDNCKCAKCQNILINACVTTCGCRYCRECVDNLLTNGINKCPGNTAGCKSQHLSNIAPDHMMNIKISKLLVKCPELMCGHECQLIEMEEHIRLCSKKRVQCPCHDLGCHDDDLICKINDHLQTDSYKHWTMLIAMIGNLRNEVREKDDRMEAMRTEMMKEIIKCQVETQAKDQIIDVMTDDIKLMKVEREMLRRQIDIVKDNLDRKIYAMTAQINGDIESIKMDRTELSGKLGNLNGKLEGIRVELDETKRGCKERMEEHLVLINADMGKYQDQMAGRMDKMETGMDRKKDLTTFVWHVDRVSMMKVQYERPSEYFFLKPNSYKIQLSIFDKNSQLQIYLRIHATPNDANLQWPIQANVTVKVTNQATPAACMEVTKYCKIRRPSKKKYSHNYKDRFKFPIADLSSKNLLLGDCCIVECLVQLQ